MSNAVANANLVSQSFVLGTVAGSVLFELVASDGSVVAVQPVAADAAAGQVAATFNAVAPGTYTVRATRQNDKGAALAAPVSSQPFTIQVPQTIMVSIPESVTVTIG